MKKFSIIFIFLLGCNFQTRYEAAEQLLECREGCADDNQVLCKNHCSSDKECLDYCNILEGFCQDNCFTAFIHNSDY